MKRHPSLIPLSRFHRSVLFLALVCKKNAPAVKGYPQDDKGKSDYATSFYNTQLKKHMALEETQLFPTVVSINGQLEKLVTELTEEHRLLERLFAELQTSNNLPDTLNQLGLLLESHVRKEERHFFQLIQESLDEKVLEQLAEKLS